MSEFKKEFKVKDKQVLNKSERKKFIQSLSVFNLNEQQIDKLFISSKSNITRYKLMGTNTLIYTNELNQPLFFDHHSKNDLYPTIYTLKTFPNLLPR